jgi:hypothetical protein
MFSAVQFCDPAGNLWDVEVTQLRGMEEGTHPKPQIPVLSDFYNGCECALVAPLVAFDAAGDNEAEGVTVQSPVS